ncbi:hypothetical protein B0O99DRAFT_631983 [Bisporella sp. PMI_857]|nr:hypothetical protein B0O99DRAFT_631983 [Bisporella sp. PMI_857]
MSSESLPITPAAFASALKDLPLSNLFLKAAEIRNSIAHLDYSNEQLRPFANGTEPGLTSPDQDCLDAIRENEVVITRMEERIRLLKKEVEDRGQSWREFASDEELKEEEGLTNGMVESNGEERSNAWSDGTFTTGRIVNGDVILDDPPAPAPTSAPNTAANGVSPTPTSNVVNGTTSTSNTNMVNGVSSVSTNNSGGRLDDDALRRALADRMAGLEDDGEGMHL